MPPRPVHPNKKEAVFHLCNFLCTSTIANLSDLADGKILLKTIQTNCAEEIKASNDIVDFGNSSQSQKESTGTSNETEESQCNPATEDDILIRFNHIQKFIDNRYKITSENIISYDECKESCELELIKVTMFVLSEIVKHLTENNTELLQTLFHLDIQCQIELEDIFKVFITERETINKSLIEKLLSKSSKHASPTTPRRTSSRRTSLKEQTSFSALECFSAPNEDVYVLNSPLKAYFESPIFRKEDMLNKDKEVKDMQKAMKAMYAVDEDNQLKFSQMEKELEKKDKDYKQLEKQNRQFLQQKEEEIEYLKNSNENLLCEYKKIQKEYNWSKEYSTNRVMDLTTQLAEVKKALEEKEKQEELRIQNRKSFSSQETSNPSMSPNKVEDSLRLEIAILKDKIKQRDIKIFTYKKQLAEKIVTELKEKNSPGNLNQSYEEVWNELSKQRKGEEEIVARAIQDDNRKLYEKLNDATSHIQNLNKEIEALKEHKNRKSINQNQPKEISSVATMTDALNVHELLDSSKIPEIERLRESLSHSKNIEHYHLSDDPSYYVLNNSDNPIPCEQSIISDESEVIIPCPEKSSEAVLWKMYDTQRHEIDSPSDIHLSHDSVASHNSRLDVINDLGVSNVKMKNNEPSALLSERGKYVLGNLNFDAFLNELKKLTRNGSFQKVLQVFGRCQNEINGTNRSNRLDLQELLKMITECVCVVVSLNAESSFANLQDKCCSTNENDFFNVNQNVEIDKLKSELSVTSQKYEFELRECKMELDELRKIKRTMEYKSQAYDQAISHKKKAIEDVKTKYQEQQIKMDIIRKKNFEYKQTINKLLRINKNEQDACELMKQRGIEQNKIARGIQKLYKSLKEENNCLKEELQKLKTERDKLLRAKEKKSIISAAYSKDGPSRESYAGVPSHLNTKSELHSSTFQDTDNESALSSIFHKSISHYVSENEGDYFDYNSLDLIKKDYENNRIEEIKRRNSLYPIHLQSSYPLECNLETTYASLYVKDGEKVKEEEHCSKKRKLDDGPMFEEPSTSSIVVTPIVKPKRKVGTPKSLQNFIRNIKYKNTFNFKPKGS